MLSRQELERVCIVLVRARNPNNIGAVARAMHDFGFCRLRVVNEYPVPFEAARSAVDASAVLADAAAYTSVAEAVADCTLVVGTTAVGERDVQHDLVTLAEAGMRIRVELRREPAPESAPAAYGTGGAAGRVALLFGSEKTGLSNEELSYCNWLLTVPMQEREGVRHASLNLGQAVAVCLYELVRDGESEPHTPQSNESERATREGEDTENGVTPVDAATLERITALLTEVMEQTGYTRRYAHNCDPAQLRRLVRRMGADQVDAPVWMGILKQVLWKLAEK